LDTPEDVSQTRYHRFTPSQPNAVIGQTFVAHAPNLSGIAVLVQLTPPSDAEASRDVSITLHLRAQSEPTRDRVTVSLNTPPLDQKAGGQRVDDHPMVLRFDFPPQPDSANQAYYFFLSPTPPTIDGVAYTDLDMVTEGERRVDHQPVKGDLWFVTHYAYGLPQAVQELLHGLMGDGRLARHLRLGVLAVTLGLLFLPGGALLILMQSGSSRSATTARTDPLITLGLAFGLSLSLAPLLILWTSTLGLRLGPGVVLVYVGGAGLIVIYGLLKRGARQHLRARWTWQDGLWGGACVLLFALVVAVRFIQVRDLVMPAWVDSVHHTLIARLIAEGGQVPATYRPFIPVDSFYYHYGFHALAAYVHWLSGAEMPQVLLILGQLLNAGAALSAYLLAVHLTGRRWVGVGAILVTGLISTMPAYYVSWGRYTQLTGLNSLPTTLLLVTMWLESLPPSFLPAEGEAGETPRRLWHLRPLLLASVSLAGLFLIHYRVLIFAACFFLAYGLHTGWTQRREGLRLAQFALKGMFLGAGSLALALPWLIRIVRTVVLPLGTFGARLQGTPNYNAAPLSYILTGQDRILVALAIGGSLWGLLRRERGIALMLLWISIVFVVVNPSVLGLPTTWLTSNASTLIILYLPFSVGVGYWSTMMYDYAKATWRRHRPSNVGDLPLQILAGGILTSVALWGIDVQVPILNPNTVLVDPDDLEAMAWIREHTSPNAVFLVNTELWMPGVYRGSDAGWWIPLLTGRQATLPPALYIYGDREYYERVNALAQAVADTQAWEDDAAWRAMLKAWGVTHVYIGARGGPLSPRTLIALPYYEPVYRHNAVWIFELRDTP
jgi:hypothetical protein